MKTIFTNIRSSPGRALLCVSLLIGCYAISPMAQAVSPAPDGCYPGFTTAEGCKALNFLTTGAGNTGLGWESLLSDTTGSYNTGVGAGALILNNGDSNTAVGAVALLLNTTGTENTAVGTDALVYNDTGANNTAVGAFALFSNTTGMENTANGIDALYGNTTGHSNTATGVAALTFNTIGHDNTANGLGALGNNTTGSDNTANGVGALGSNTVGNFNTADGDVALNMCTGSFNIALGYFAGLNLTTGDHNIDIGNQGVADEANTIRIGTSGIQTATFIAGISGTAVVGDAVVVDANGQLGTATSSARFKKQIKPMDKTSEAILALKPVSFQYKSDSKGTPQFGLIAEEVAKVNPDLVVHDRNGEIYSVRYEAVNAMLLNEFLKARRQIDVQQKQIEALTAGLQKVSAQLEATKPAPQVVNNP